MHALKRRTHVHSGAFDYLLKPDTAPEGLSVSRSDKHERRRVALGAGLLVAAQSQPT